MSKIVKLLSGGQSGSDRGAMDAATAYGIPVGGWCPAGGWAEDLTEPPGVRALYPQIVETPSADVTQRTEWNIRDSTCCMVLKASAEGVSPGTDVGYTFYEKYSTPNYSIVLDSPVGIEEQLEQACAWMEGLDNDAIVISFGGPRASEYPGVYEIAYNVVTALLERFA